MSAPELPPLQHEPDEGRNRLTIVIGGVLLAIIVLIVGVVIVTRDDTEPAAQPPADTAANLPPPANMASVTSGPVDDNVDSATTPAEGSDAQTAVQILSVGIPPTHQCAPGATDETIPLQWETIGAQSVSISLGSGADSAPIQSGLPASGSVDVPAPCAPNTNTYTVNALGTDGTIATQQVQSQGV